MYQLKLLFHQNSDTLRDYLESATGKSITLIITDNTVSMLSLRHKKRNAILIRLHWMFLHADNDVIREIAAFIKTKNYKTPSITRFIQENRKCIRKESVKPLSINAQGKYHSLNEIFDFLNTRYFDDRIKAVITWGKRRSRWYKGKRTLGSYDQSNSVIRINPLLDQKSVPKYFVEFIVYHEMIHADMKTKKDRGKKLIHTKEFKRREQLFEKYKKAVLWEKRHLR
jgi:predicted metal-dependent hydrolase